MRLTRRSKRLSGILGAVLAAAGCKQPEPPPPLTIWHSLPSQEARALDTLVKPLQESHPDWGLTLKAIQTDSIVGRIGSPDGPDAALIPLSALPELIQDQRLLPLDAYLSERDRVDFLPAAWQRVYAQNHAWGIPFEISCQGLFYRKSAFASDAVSVPATMSDLEAVGEVFQKAHPKQAFLSLPTDPATLQPMLWAFGGSMVQDDKWQQTTHFLLSLRSKQVLGPFHKTPESCIDVLAAGRTAMAIGTPEHLRKLTELTTKDELGIAPLPGKVPTPMSGRVWVVSPKAKRVEAALVAVKSLSTTEVSAKWAADMSRVPARLSAFEDPLIRQRPALTAFKDLLNNARPLERSDIRAVASMAPEWRPYLIGLKKLEMPKPPVAAKPSPSPAANKPAVKSGKDRAHRRQG